MKPPVYIEPSIISYLAARPSRDLIVAANQQATHDWWNTRRTRFDLMISEIVLIEIAGGDAGAAVRRAVFASGLRSAPATMEAAALAEEIIRAARIPRRAVRDAAHIAIA